MTDERMDGARSVRDAFLEDLDRLRTGSFDAYRKFMLQYFSSHAVYTEMNLLISFAEMGGIQLTDPDLEDFRKLFRDTACDEFFKKKERFPDEGIQLGFMK